MTGELEEGRGPLSRTVEAEGTATAVAGVEGVWGGSRLRLKGRGGGG